jgi:hypothetical protein
MSNSCLTFLFEIWSYCYIRIFKITVPYSYTCNSMYVCKGVRFNLFNPFMLIINTENWSIFPWKKKHKYFEYKISIIYSNISIDEDIIDQYSFLSLLYIIDLNCFMTDRIVLLHLYIEQNPMIRFFVKDWHYTNWTIIVRQIHKRKKCNFKYERTNLT